MDGLCCLDALHGQLSRKLFRRLLRAHCLDGFALALRIELGGSCSNGRGLERLRRARFQILRKQFFLKRYLLRRNSKLLVIIGYVEPISARAALCRGSVAGHAARTGFVVNTQNAPSLGRPLAVDGGFCQVG
jgi:hypothetical protein